MPPIMMSSSSFVPVCAGVAVLGLAVCRSNKLKAGIETQIKECTQEIRENYPSAWTMISDKHGVGVSLESLKGYVRMSRYQLSVVRMEKKCAVSRLEYAELLRAALFVTKVKSKKKRILSSFKTFAKKKWNDTAKGTELISPISPSPDAIIDAVLTQIRPKKSDVFYDLGCGDARWLCRAAALFGCKCVGLEIEPARVAAAHKNIAEANVADKVTIRTENILNADISDASIVLMYLFPDAMVELSQTFADRVQAGTTLVAVQFRFPTGWRPVEQTIRPKVSNYRTVYVYTSP